MVGLLGVWFRWFLESGWIFSTKKWSTTCPKLAFHMISAIRSGWLAVSEWQVEKADDLLENCMKDFTVQNERGAHAWCGLMRLDAAFRLSFLVQRVEVLCRFLPQGRNSIWHNLIGSPWYYIIMWVRLQHMFGKQRTFHHQKLRLAVLLDTGEPIWLQPGAKLQVGRMDFGALYTWVEVGRWIWGSLLLRSRPRRFWAFHILLHVIWMIETSGTTARGLMRWCGGILTFLAFAHMLDADHTLMAILRRNECVRFGTEASKGFLLQNCSLLHQNRKLSFKGTQSQRSSCLLSRESHQSWPIFCHIRD